MLRWFWSFQIPKETLKFIGNKDVTVNIYRIKTYDRIMCWCFCVDFADYMFKAKRLSGFRNLFSLINFKNNDKVFLNYILKWG